MLKKLAFDLQYRFGKPPWDSGVTPPEVVAQIERGAIGSGRALDLGCGTGTNSIYLAQHGFAVVGVDFSPKAIATARDKARRAGVAINWHVADVSRLDFLSPRFDFVLDIGCFHSIEPTDRPRYEAHLARLTRSGGMYMLYAFGPRQDNTDSLIKPRAVGVTDVQVQKTFAQDFAFEHREQGVDRGNRASAWYWLKKK